jgi:small ubiquitin-related modifier
MAATVSLGRYTDGAQQCKSRAVDLPFTGRCIPDYVAILRGQVALLGCPKNTEVDATIPKTSVVALGDKVGGFPGQLTLVALHNDEEGADRDVDLTSPSTYTLVVVSSDRSETVKMPLSDCPSLQLSTSLFCSLIAANTPRVSDTPTSIYLRPTAEAQLKAWGWDITPFKGSELFSFSAESTLSLKVKNPASTEDTVNIFVRDQDNSGTQFKIHRTTRMQMVHDAFCVHKGLSEYAVRLVFDGVRIIPDLTPEDLEMENGDSVDAFCEQVGGMFVASSGRDNNEALAMESLAPDVDVTICIPGGKHVTVSIGAHRTFKEATALAALQLQFEAAETQAAKMKETMADIITRMRVLAGADEGTG